MPGNADRRPWLLISAAEAQALLAAALAEPQQDGSGDKPSVHAAIQRDGHQA